MGGGALSSDYVSKLGSKEVSKRLRNFIPRPYDGRGCHEVTGEGESQIAQQVRDDKLRHPELVSGSKAVMNLTTYPIYNPSRPSLEKGRRVAFTLAEVLITLGIIGVVASLTLPSVITNYQKKRTVNKLKSTYSILCNAIQMAKVDYGDDINQWELPDGIDKKASSDYFSEKYLIPYLKIAKDCNPYVANECLPTNMQYNRTFILTNGAIISVNASRELALRLQIYMYINGYKKKMNQARDVFLIELGGGSGSLGLDKNNLLPYGYSVRAPRTNYTAFDGTSCSKTGSKSRCFALIMYDGWKISDDYPW